MSRESGRDEREFWIERATVLVDWLVTEGVTLEEDRRDATAIIVAALERWGIAPRNTATALAPWSVLSIDERRKIATSYNESTRGMPRNDPRRGEVRRQLGVSEQQLFKMLHRFIPRHQRTVCSGVSSGILAACRDRWCTIRDIAREAAPWAVRRGSLSGVIYWLVEKAWLEKRKEGRGLTEWRTTTGGAEELLRRSRLQSSAQGGQKMLCIAHGLPPLPTGNRRACDDECFIGPIAFAQAMRSTTVDSRETTHLWRRGTPPKTRSTTDANFQASRASSPTGDSATLSMCSCRPRGPRANSAGRCASRETGESEA